MKLLETIRFENGRFANLDLHQQRMNTSRKALFNIDTEIDLVRELWPRSRSSGFVIRTQLDADLKSAKSGIGNPKASNFQITPACQQGRNLKELEGLFKCRIIYSEQIEEIEFIPYQLPKIQSLKMVVDDKINYSHKYFDRSHLDKLFSQKGDCTDILIVKNGLITDTSFANILFFNGKQWLTPSQPLLKGTQRQFLLAREQITIADIRPSDLKYFQKVRLVNAMMRLEDRVEVPLVRIYNPDV